MDGVKAFQQNYAGLLLECSGYYPTARCWQEDNLLIALMGPASPTLNGVLVLDQVALTEERLSALERCFTDEQIPLALEIHAYQTVPDCDPLLRDHGYERVVCDPILIHEGSLADRVLNPSIQVHPLMDEQDQQAYRQIMINAFMLPPESEASSSFDMMFSLPGSHPFLAWLKDEPVGCGLLLYCNEVASIYNISTREDRQRQGVATAMMYTLHEQALADGFAATVLAVQSDAGRALYRTLGYRQDGYQLIYLQPTSN